MGVGLCLTAVLVILRTVLWPCDVPVSASADSQAEKITKDQSAVPPPSLKQFEALWRKRLRRPLVDPPPPKPVDQPAVVQRRPPPNVRLLGIALESGHSLAMFVNPQGAIELKAIGEMLGDGPNGPQVTAIEDERVVLRYQGETITVPLEGEKGR